MVIEPLVYTEFSDSIVLCSTKRHTCVTLYNKILHVQKISRFFVSAMITQHAPGKNENIDNLTLDLSDMGAHATVIRPKVVVLERPSP